MREREGKLRGVKAEEWEGSGERDHHTTYLLLDPLPPLPLFV